MKRLLLFLLIFINACKAMEEHALFNLLNDSPEEIEEQELFAWFDDSPTISNEQQNLYEQKDLEYLALLFRKLTQIPLPLNDGGIAIPYVETRQKQQTIASQSVLDILNKSTGYECSHCNNFVYKRDKILHNAWHTKEIMNYSCDRCMKASNNKSFITSHFQSKGHYIAMGKKPISFHCDVLGCYKHYFTKKNLKEHRRNVHFLN